MNKKQAEQLADQDPLKKLNLAYGEVLETLGYELLPVIQEFAAYIKSDVLPIIDVFFSVLVELAELIEL